MNRKLRNLLVELIINDMFGESYKLIHEDFLIISETICSIFPTENAGTYYIPYINAQESGTHKPNNAKGKLVDKYRSLKRLYKIIYNTNDSPSKPGIPIDATQSAQWLKNNNDPWDEVIKHWENTFQLRRTGNDKKTLSNILTEWPILKNINALTLVGVVKMFVIS